MRLAVVSRHGLDALESLVRAAFQEVPAPALEAITFSPDAVLPAQLARLIKVRHTQLSAAVGGWRRAPPRAGGGL